MARHRGAADEPEVRVARRLELRLALLRDALHVAHREQAAQVVLVVHDEQLVDAGMFGEKFVGAGDRVLPSSFLLMVWTWARGVSASATLRLA